MAHSVAGSHSSINHDQLQRDLLQQDESRDAASSSSGSHRSTHSRPAEWPINDAGSGAGGSGIAVGFHASQMSQRANSFASRVQSRRNPMHRGASTAETMSSGGDEFPVQGHEAGAQLRGIAAEFVQRMNDAARPSNGYESPEQMHETFGRLRDIAAEFVRRTDRDARPESGRGADPAASRRARARGIDRLAPPRADADDDGMNLMQKLRQEKQDRELAQMMQDQEFETRKAELKTQNSMESLKMLEQQQYATHLVNAGHASLRLAQQAV